jgi:hypothetical protein
MEKPKFKIGDRVKIIKSFDLYSYIGLPGTIVERNSYAAPSVYTFQLDDLSVPRCTVFEYELDFFYENALVKLKKRYKK